MFLRKHDDTRKRPTRTSRLALAAATILGALAIAPGVADAGTYQMYNCHVAGHETGNHGPWTYSTAYGAPGTTLFSACSGAGGPAGPEFGPYAPSYLGQNSRSNLTLQKDNQNISIGTIKLWFWSTTAIAPTYSPGPITTTLWADGAKYAEWSGGQIANYVGAPFEFHANGNVTLSLACAGAPEGCMPDGGFPVRVGGVQVDLSESLAPGAAISGPLTAAGAQTGTKAVTIQATDPDSGVKKVDVLLDDQVVDSLTYDRDWTKPLSEQQAGTCAYDSWNACPTSQTASLNVNTKLVPDGTYALAARVTDAAGNVTTTAPQTVTIDNVPDPAPPAAPASPVPGPKGDVGVIGPNGANGATGPAGPATPLTRNGTNASPQAAITARFVGYSGTAIRASYGKTVRLTGQLLAPGGAPIAGAKVTVFQRDKMIGAAFVPHSEVVTDAEGRFAYTTVAARSRTIRFAYRANLEDVDFARTLDVALGVVPRLTLKTNKRSLRNGQAVRFSGAIASAPANAKKVVELQVRKGKGWMTFTTTRLKKGHFAYAYKFKRTRGLVTYQFRARVREEAGFPFLSGHSKTVKVTVRG